jgi:hypothetical protein
VREGDRYSNAGDVFLIRSVDNRYVAVSKLDDDFMDTNGDTPISVVYVCDIVCENDDA